MTVQAITSLSQFQEIINSGEPVVVDFWAEWCGPCRVISPVFESLSKQFTSVRFCKVNSDDNQDISQEVGIAVLPTFLAFVGGNKVGELKGANPGKLQDLIQQLA